MRAFFSLVALLLLAPPLSATIVTVEANDTSGFSYFNGDDLNFGVTVLLGTFQTADGTALSDQAIRQNAENFNSLLANFTQFSTTGGQIGNGSPNRGELSVELSGSTAGSPGLAGKQIYYFVISGTNNSTVAASIATANQIGVFYLDRAALSSWAFPSDGAIPNTTTVDIADLTIGNLGVTLKAGARVVLGSFGPDNSNAHAGAKNFGLVFIPEPSTGALFALAAGGLLGVRRCRGRRDGAE